MTSLPATPVQLQHQIAKQMLIAGLVIGLVAGAVAYFLEARRAEAAAFGRAVESARHFESAEMRSLVRQGSRSAHPQLRGFLDRTNFVGIRILASGGDVVTEAWESGLDRVRNPLGAGTPALPGAGERLSHWVSAGDERFIRVVVPLQGADPVPDGYVEGFYRIDPETRLAMQERIRDAGATGALAALLTTLVLYPLLRGLLRRTLDLSQTLLDANVELMRTLGSAIAKRDSDTDAHNYRVTLYAVRLAEAMGRPPARIADLIAGAFLHDVGKIGTPDAILLKPGKLTDAEFAVMRRHVLVGQDIVAGNGWLEKAQCVIRHHHEKFDGSGYPDALAGESIPGDARLFAVVDVFDALTSVRPYKGALPAVEALRIIERDSASHFDPAIVAVFRSLAEPLFREIGEADPATLRAWLTDVMVRYYGRQLPRDPIPPA